MKSQSSSSIVNVLSCRVISKNKGGSESHDHQVSLLLTNAMRSNLHPSFSNKYQHENTPCSVINMEIKDIVVGIAEMVYQNPSAPWAEVKYQRVFDLNVTSQNQKSSRQTV